MGSSAEPFLGRSPVAWRIHRETALLLGGPRALLLQLAHPLVAQGVADHSEFLERLRRLLEEAEERPRGAHVLGHRFDVSIELGFADERAVAVGANRVSGAVLGFGGEPRVLATRAAVFVPSGVALVHGVILSQS